MVKKPYMQKKRVIERTNVPDAMKKHWRAIEEVEPSNRMSKIREVDSYQMGRLMITYAPANDKLPDMLAVSHPSRLPSWDELVWIRYAVCPHIDELALILPRLEDYINHTGGTGKWTMTMEAVTRGVGILPEASIKRNLEVMQTLRATIDVFERDKEIADGAVIEALGEILEQKERIAILEESLRAAEHYITRRFDRE